MAKKTSLPETTAITPKKTKVGAVIGSIVLFLLTFFVSILLLCSSTLYISTQQNSFSTAAARIDLSQVELTDDGKTQDLGSWVYTWYMRGAPNLTTEYAQAALAHSEVRDILCDYLENLSAYLQKETDEMPQLQAEDFTNALESLSSELQAETGVTFTDEDKDFILWATDEDIPEWNNTMYNLVGRGVGKTIIRFFCTLPGVITAAVLFVALLILWLIFACKGHWKKHAMCIGYGTAAGLLSLLLLLGGGILLLLVNALDVIAPLSCVAKGLPTLLLPAIWSSLGIALYGVILVLIGLCIRSAFHKKQAKLAQNPDLHAAQTEAFVPPTESTPVQSQATDADANIPEIHPTEKDASFTAKQEADIPALCPHCGAKNETGSKFCGACGKAMT